MIRSLILYDFKSGLNAKESFRRIADAFGEETISLRGVQHWFQRFRSGDFCLEDRPRSGRPSDFDDDRLRQLVEDDPYLTSRAIATMMDVSQPTIIAHLRNIGKVSKLD